MYVCMLCYQTILTDIYTEREGQVPVERKSYRLSRHHGLNLMPMCMTEFQFLLLRVQSRFAETLTLTLTLHPNFGESGFGESGKRLLESQTDRPK